MPRHVRGRPAPLRPSRRGRVARLRRPARPERVPTPRSGRVGRTRSRPAPADRVGRRTWRTGDRPSTRIVGDPGNRWRVAITGSVASISMMATLGPSAASSSASMARAAQRIGQPPNQSSSTRGDELARTSAPITGPLPRAVPRAGAAAASGATATTLPAWAVAHCHLVAAAVKDDRLGWIARRQMSLQGSQSLVQVREDLDSVADLGSLPGDEAA